MLDAMDATPDPSQPDGGAQRAETREELRVTVRRSPKYGVFMAIGALIGIVSALIISSTSTPGVNEAGQRVDTTPVIGLMLVIGFVVGGVLGGIVALIVDRALAKGTRTVLAERIETHEADAVVGPAADVDEAVFEHLEPTSEQSAPGQPAPRAAAPGQPAPGAAPEDDRPREA